MDYSGKSAIVTARAQRKGAAIWQSCDGERLAPEIVATETLDAISRGDFLIVAHPTARAAAERRWQSIDQALARGSWASLRALNLVGRAGR